MGGGGAEGAGNQALSVLNLQIAARLPKQSGGLFFAPEQAPLPGVRSVGDPPPEKQVYRAVPGRPGGGVLCCHIPILTLGKSAALPEPAQGPATRPGLGAHREDPPAGPEGPAFPIPPPTPPTPQQDKGGRGQAAGRPRLFQTTAGFLVAANNKNPSVSGTSLKPLGIVLRREKNSRPLLGSSASEAGGARSH